MYCPKCGCEYREGFFTCSTCNVDLVAEEPIIKTKNLYAGFLRRIGAGFVDMILLSIVIVPIIYFLNFYYFIKFVDNPNAMLIIYIINLILELAPFIIYFSLFESSKYKATLGKQLFKISVVDSSGMQLSLKRSVARATFKLMAGISLIGIALICVTNKKQGLHDLFSNTYVIRTDSENEFANFITETNA